MACREQHDELVWRCLIKSCCPQRETSLTPGSERQTETVGWPGSRQRLGSNDHRKRLKASRCSVPRTSSGENGASVSPTCFTRFEEGIRTLQDNDINLMTIDDVSGWVLMRKANLTQEQRERLIAAVPYEHFRINDVKPVLVRLFH